MYPVLVIVLSYLRMRDLRGFFFLLVSPTEVLPSLGGDIRTEANATFIQFAAGILGLSLSAERVWRQEIN